MKIKKLREISFDRQHGKDCDHESSSVSCRETTESERFLCDFSTAKEESMSQMWNSTESGETERECFERSVDAFESIHPMFRMLHKLFLSDL